MCVVGGRSGSLEGCQSDGPIFVFERPSNVTDPSTTDAAAPAPTPTLALSALLNFTLSAPNPTVLGVTTHRPYANTSALLLARPGFVRANRGFGSIMRQYHQTRRRRAIHTEGLSYWNDNQAGYSFLTIFAIDLPKQYSFSRKEALIGCI